jgi:NTP pyrophosphatase (non-canonical NTP hydrolase)
MKWYDFVKATDNTAVYPEAGSGSVVELAYIALGLAGEIGEAIEASSEPHGVRAELADALWYVARGMRALQVHGYQLADVCPGSTKNMQEAPLLVANTTKKLMRDGLERATLDHLAVLYSLSLDALYEMLAELETNGTEQIQMDRFEGLLEDLVFKLESRKARGVLHGSGDAR